MRGDMKITTCLILRRISILVTLLFFSTILNAQTGVKIKSRVEINSNEPTNSLTLNYPASLYIYQAGMHYLYNMKITCGFDTVVFYQIDPETGEVSYVSGNWCKSIFPAGTALTSP